MPDWLVPGWCGEPDRRTDMQMCQTKQHAGAFREELRSVMGAAERPCPCMRVLVRARERAFPTAARPSPHSDTLSHAFLIIWS